MSGVDEQQQGAGTETEQAVNDGLKLVPVGESIRYRKRAQSAESKAELLAEELAQVKSEASQVREQLNDIKLEQQLMRKLSAAGAVDLEAAVLLVKSRIKCQGETELDGCVEQLKQEKQYLFSDGSVTARSAAKKTSAAKQRHLSSQGTLEMAAKRASDTGNRADLQKYLRLRRSFL